MAKKKAEEIKVNSIQELIGAIETKIGDGSVMKGRGAVVPVEVFSTDIAAIDFALGCAGIPRGRIIEIYGAESSGKTTTCLQIIAACQKHRFGDRKNEFGVAAFIDAEHALDPSWAEKIGVNMDELLISQPNSGEEAFTVVETMVKSNLVDLIVVDSVAALVPQEELNGELSDHQVGAQARMMSKALRRLKGEMAGHKCTVLFINQVREKVGIVFGNPESTPGGRALKFYASVRAEISKGSAIKSDADVVGFTPKIKIVKNKVGAPFVSATYDICVGHPARPIYGIDYAASLIDVAKKFGIVELKGSSFRYNDQPIGQGLANASQTLRENGELFAEIKSKTYEVAFGHSHHNPISLDEVDLDDVLED